MSSYHPELENDRSVWVFDLDNTLYPAECNLFDQVDKNIGAYVSNLLGLNPEDARKVQKRYLLEYGTTLNGLMHNHGIDPEHYLDSVHDIDFSPIKEDLQLKAALEKLDGKKVIFTNADLPYSEKILARLGIADAFDGIFDILAADLAPKPKPETYKLFIEKFGIDPTKSVMFEDMARNLIPAHEMGMATVWINTGSTWGEADHDPNIIHEEIDSLSDWLNTFAHR